MLWSVNILAVIWSVDIEQEGQQKKLCGDSIITELVHHTLSSLNDLSG